MATRPSVYPRWTDGDPSKVTQPPAAQSLSGWTPGQPPPRVYVNWLQWETGEWIEYLDTVLNTGVPNSNIRLINGGLWSFNATTGALAWSQDADLAIPSLPDASNTIAAGSVTLADGQVAYVAANTPSASVADATNGSDILTNVNFVGNISVGMDVTGPGIPGGTTVTFVGTNSVTLSANATSDETQQTYVFSNSGPITVQVADNTALVPTIATVLLARRAGNVVYLGVNCAQMVLRDGEFKPLIGTGYEVVYQSAAGENLTAGQLVYASPGVSDGGRTTGALYKLDVSAANQAVRGTYAGMVITDVTTGNQATVVYSGLTEALGALTAGSTYYADPATPGGVTVTQPSGSGQKIVPVGYSTSSTVMLLAGVAFGNDTVKFPLFDDSVLGVGDGSTTVFTLPSSPYDNTSVAVFVGGLKVPPGSGAGKVVVSGTTVTLGTAPPIGAQVEAFELLSGQSYLRMTGEVAADTGDHETFSLSNAPLSKGAIMVFVGGTKQPPSAFSLVLGATPQIKFVSALPIGELPDVTYAY